MLSAQASHSLTRLMQECLKRSLCATGNTCARCACHWTRMRQWRDSTAVRGLSHKPQGTPPCAHGGHPAPRRGPQVIPFRVAEPLIAVVHNAPSYHRGTRSLAHALQTRACPPTTRRAVGQCRRRAPAQSIAPSTSPQRIAGEGCPTDQRRAAAAGARARPGGFDPPPLPVHPPPPIGGGAATRTTPRVAASSGEPPAPHALGATRDAAAAAPDAVGGSSGGAAQPAGRAPPGGGSRAAATCPIL